MEFVVHLKLKDILASLQTLSVDEVEQIKKSLVKRDIYFRKHCAVPLSEITSDFQKEGYSPEFIRDLQEGLIKSSVYRHAHNATS